MIVNVRMLAFMDGELRPVDVPDAQVRSDTHQMLEQVYYFGQNDFQPVPKRCSVSIGDVALLNGKFYIVRTCGWAEISPRDLEAYEKLDVRDRGWSEYVGRGDPHLTT